MKIISWNVNGFRAVKKKGFLEYLEKEDPDIFCLQEIKMNHSEEIEGYESFWNFAEKKGYSGTAIFTKLKPINVFYDLGQEEFDAEGRVITLEYEKFYLTTVYTPNSKRGLLRVDYRVKWDAYFLKYLKKLQMKKPVIICGDFNVAHKEIDLANPKSNYDKTAGYSQKEINGMDNLQKEFIDTFREFNKDPKNYTWWSYMFKARDKNIGWRIDYFLISKQLRNNLKDAFIRKDVLGSDHCPIGIQLK